MLGLSYLNAVVTVGKVVHWLVLLVNDANASLVRAVGDRFNVLSTLAHLDKLGANVLGRFDGGLRVELGYKQS